MRFVSILMEDQMPVMVADNDNFVLVPDWMTPAEFLQVLKGMRDEMRRKLEADATLLTCPTHRKDWAILDAMERCGRWHLFDDRGSR